MKFYEKIAKHNNWSINSDPAIVQLVADGLQHNKEEHGAMYCPCLITRTVDTICPCRGFRELPHGKCHCGLYTKP
jgi:ferredoxin-thioredoxin reductase catalytic subunit